MVSGPPQNQSLELGARVCSLRFQILGPAFTTLSYDLEEAAGFRMGGGGAYFCLFRAGVMSFNIERTPKGEL